MQTKYKLLLTLLAGLLLWPAAAFAQSELVVEYLDDNGELIENALRDAIVQDSLRPADRVYVLRRGGLYYNVDTINNSGFHLRIVGETEDAVPAGEPDYGPAVIQMVEVDGGAARMFTINNDFTLRNVWITGQGDNGSTTSYQPIQIDGTDRDIVIDNAIFERSNFQIIGVTGRDNRMTVTNSVFRNFINTTQQWEGRGISFTAGAQSLVMENNTFLNIGHTVVQSEARPIEYIRFVHNTMVNIGRTINSGGIWKEAYFANNLGVNVGWHGEDEADFSATRETAHNGIFGVGELPPQFGTDLEREVVFVNNAFWRDPAFESWYDANGYISQPLFTSELREGFEETIRTTQDFFDELPNMLAESNQWQVNPGLVSYTQAPAVDQFPETSIPLEDLVPDMIQTMETLRAGSTTPNWEDAWLWDPGREPGFYQAVGFVYPLPEDLSYTNETLRTAGTNGLPLGDLNWFPEAKEQWEANREQYIADIHEMVESEEVEIVAEFEAEDGVVEGDATVETVEGDTWLTIRPGGYMEWTFEIDESKEYWLDAHVHHAGRETSGIDKILNGEAIFDERGWGQFVYEPALQGVPADEWTTVRWTQDDLNENSAGAFTLPEGENTLRIQQSWADDTMWKGFDWIDPATEEVVVSLRAPQATYDAFLPGCGEDVEFCSSAFQHVAVGTGGSVSFNVDLPVTGEYLVRLFTNGAGTASVLVDDSEAVPYVLLDETTGMVLSERFQADAGVRKITVSSDAGGWDFDWGQVLVIGGTVSNERGKELPDGFALGQNYPNPFNPSTTIQYQLGKAGAAKVAVYDVLGRHVRTLVDGEMPAGQHVVTWDGRAADGSMVASGVYFYRLEAGGAFKARSMVMLK